MLSSETTHKGETFCCNCRGIRFVLATKRWWYYIEPKSGRNYSLSSVHGIRVKEEYHEA